MIATETQPDVKLCHRCQKPAAKCTCALPFRDPQPTPIGALLQPLIEKMEAVSVRDCRTCGRPFDAVGFVGVCEACDGITPAKPAKAVEFHASWPKRALLRLPTAHGPAIDKARALLPKAIDGLLILTGDRGTGKTVMAAWLEQARQNAMQEAGIYTKAHDLFELIKRSWHPQSKETEHEVLMRFRKAAFLVIDEAQERSESDWENRTLVNIIDHRYDAMLPTVMIANLKADELDTCLGPSILRRAKETGGLVECNWKSYV